MVVRAGRVQRLFAQPLCLAGVDHPAVLLVEDAGRAGVEHDDADAAEVAAVAPADGGGVGVRLGGEGAQDVGAVGGLADGGVQEVLGQFARGEVAEVLVDPVRHQAAEDPLAPPGVARMSATQEALVFQSSMTSWSSKIMQLGTVDSSQRISGSSQDS